MKFLNWKLLLGVILAMFLAVFLYFSSDGFWAEKNIKGIQSNVLSEIKKAEFNGNEIEKLLESKSYNFKLLSERAEFPLFLYKNNSLFFWSSTSIQPNFEEFIADSLIHFVVLKNGSFLCLSREVQVAESKYLIVQLIPLYTKYGYQNEYIKNGPNPSIFGKARLRINNFQTEGYNFKDKNGHYLFSIEKFYPERRSWDYFFDGITFLIYGIIFGMLFFLYQYLIKKNWLKTGERKLVFWFGAYFIGRIFTLQIGFPTAFYETHIFDPKYILSSFWAISLGDVCLDSLFLLGLSAFIFKIFSKMRIVNFVLNKENKSAFLWILGFLVLISHALLLLIFYTVGILYEQAGVSLNFLQVYGFSFERVIGILIFLSYSLIFFLINQITVRLGLVITESVGRRAFFLVFLTATFIYVIVTGAINYSFLLITILSSFYYLLAWWFRLPLSLNKLRFDTYIYFFTCAIICASVGAYSAFRHTKYRIIAEKISFARQVLGENDFLAENLLLESAKKITKDPFIIKQLEGPIINYDLIEQKIRKVHLDNYFNRFTLKITLFNSKGAPFFSDPTIPNADKLKKILKEKNFQTEVPDLFFVKNLKGNIVKQYFYFIPIKKGAISMGRILVEISPKRSLPPVNVYPALLISQPDVETTFLKEFDYAIYQDSLLVYSSGIYNYLTDFDISVFNKSSKSEILFNQSGFDHVVLKEPNAKTIIVSSASLPLKDLLTMFSFLFLFLLFLSTVFVILYTIFVQRDLFSANFTTKIQIYINLAFFLPLFVISVATVGYITGMYESDLKDSYEKKSSLISQQLSDVLEKYENKKIKLEVLESTVLQLSKNTDTDLDLYDKKGRLIISSQPAIYSAGILSNLMDPMAIYEVLEKQSNVSLLPQKVGDFSYFKVYHSIRSAETAEIIGIIGLPFFGSKEELNKRRTEIINYMLNIFTLIFIFFLLISFLSARILIIPLKIVTQKIRKVTLMGNNEPILWDSKDEIGLLISEYNNMLIKLKLSTRALADSEKESAWREMAQQVAHEIKNPLTPMKLTLQYFKGRLDSKESILDSKPIENVLQQIDKLVTIANSFSSFATFPEPIFEPFDLIKAIKTTTDLHNIDGTETVDLELESETCMVLGDVGFVERIFTNLILNAVQAIPIGKIPIIKIDQKNLENNRVIVSVSDNGEGIPEEIKDKVFLPNFSTKYAGSGIGLALAKKGIEQSGGKIWFTSILGKGTTFFIELPTITID